MVLLDLVLGLVILGVGLYLLELLPMDATIKQIIRVVVILMVVLYVFSALFGFQPGVGGMWRTR